MHTSSLRSSHVPLGSCSPVTSTMGCMNPVEHHLAVDDAMGHRNSPGSHIAAQARPDVVAFHDAVLACVADLRTQ